MSIYNYLPIIVGFFILGALFGAMFHESSSVSNLEHKIQVQCVKYDAFYLNLTKYECIRLEN